MAPYLVPGSTDRLKSSSVLWHPDLHLENIFVDSVTGEITSVVDWQSACVAPMPTFGTVWESWAILQRPEDYDNFSEVRQNMVDKELESGMLRK